MKMDDGFKLTPRNVAAFVLGMLLYGLLFGGAFYRDRADGSLASFFGEILVFAVMVHGILAVGLLAVWVSQWVRNRKRFDSNGAAVEMGTIRGRVGTKDEIPGDNTACAIQYAGTTLLLAAVLFGFFMIHGA